MKNSTKIYMGITGILLIALGIICICNPGATILSTSIIIGILTLASGISTLFTWFKLNGIIPAGNIFLSGVLQIILGIILLKHNLIAAATLPIVFSCWIMVEGIILAIRSFDFKQVRFKSWWILLILGLTAAVLGFYGLVYPFEVAGEILSYFIGAGIIALGAVDIVALIELNKLDGIKYTWIDEQ